VNKRRSVPFGAEDFLGSLSTMMKAHAGAFDWAFMGTCIRSCIRCVPRYDVMYGPLDKPAKVGHMMVLNSVRTRHKCPPRSVI
jgi:hypothetical protein